MFKCQVTNKNSKPGDKCNKVVVATRPRTYTENVWEEGELIELEVGHGYEIVREINASDEGLNMWRAWSDEEKSLFLSRVLGILPPHSYVQGQ